VNEIRIGDCRETMAALIAERVRVQTCITSPPYFGLRDYGTAKWKGGDAGCDHRSPTMRDGRNEDRAMLAGSHATNAGQLRLAAKTGCGKCGAVLVDSQIGLEETPAQYVDEMVNVFRLVRHLLVEDGTLWLNLGDSYAGHNIGDFRPGNESKNGGVSNKNGVGYVAGLKPKDLIGIPWRVAFALQADGWYLRSDVIWAKTNPMPESVEDRPTKSHEYIFLLSKSRDYFYDAAAVAEPVDPKNGRDSSTAPRSQPPGMGSHTGFLKGRRFETRNKRSVWTVSTQPFTGAHFATFPPELILPCVLAGSRPGDVVFDPFMGSGTTALVAKENGRRYLGCELNPEYRALQEERLAQDVLFGPEVSA
jgi:DNA modification methylase